MDIGNKYNAHLVKRASIDVLIGMRRKDDTRSRKALSQRTSPKSHSSQEDDIDVHKDGDSPVKCTGAKPDMLRRRIEAAAYKSYLEGAPKLEHLISLSRLNVHQAVQDNIVAIGMTASWMVDDDSISIFNLQVPGFTEDDIPLSLRPTVIQRKVPHHPWLDFFPFPRMRDNLILAGDSFDDEQLCHDVTAFWDNKSVGTTLLVWGQPWDPKNWEVSEAFIRKWGWALKGCSEILQSTNTWRRRRGDDPLVWQRIVELD